MHLHHSLAKATDEAEPSVSRVQHVVTREGGWMDMASSTRIKRELATRKLSRERLADRRKTWQQQDALARRKALCGKMKRTPADCSSVLVPRFAQPDISAARSPSTPGYMGSKQSCLKATSVHGERLCAAGHNMNRDISALHKACHCSGHGRPTAFLLWAVHL